MPSNSVSLNLATLLYPYLLDIYIIKDKSVYYVTQLLSSITEKEVIPITESNKKRLSRSQAIREKCLDCCAYQRAEVRLCPSTSCPLWRYRRGKEEHDDLYQNNSKNDELEEV